MCFPVSLRIHSSLSRLIEPVVIQEGPDISQHEVEVANTADAPDSVAAEAVVDIPVDEDMANTDEHDDTVMADVEAQQDETLDAEDLGKLSDAPPSGVYHTVPHAQQQSPVTAVEVQLGKQTIQGQ